MAKPKAHRPGAKAIVDIASAEGDKSVSFTVRIYAETSYPDALSEAKALAVAGVQELVDRAPRSEDSAP